MKKKLLILIFAILLTLTACNSTYSKPTGSTTLTNEFISTTNSTIKLDNDQTSESANIQKSTNEVTTTKKSDKEQPVVVNSDYFTNIRYTSLNDFKKEAVNYTNQESMLKLAGFKNGKDKDNISYTLGFNEKDTKLILVNKKIIYPSKVPNYSIEEILVLPNKITYKCKSKNNKSFNISVMLSEISISNGKTVNFDNNVTKITIDNTTYYEFNSAIFLYEPISSNIIDENIIKSITFKTIKIN